MGNLYIYLYIYIYVYMGKIYLYVNGSGNWGSNPGRVIPKTQKWYLMLPCLTLSIIKYKSRVKCSNPGKIVVPSPIPWCSSK